MSLTDAITSLGALTYVLTHQTNPGYDSNGRVVASTTTSGTTKGLMQPISGKLIERSSEGLSEGEKRAYWTTDVLITADSDAGTKGDLVTADGLQWEVVAEESWGSFGTHHKYILARTS